MLIKLLIFFLAFYLFFKIFGRYILPFIIKKIFNKYQQKNFDRHGQDNPKQQRKEGEIHVEKPSGETKRTDQEGEYIDYEEIKGQK